MKKLTGKMKLTGLIPLLRTKDMEGTIQFYKQKLGFICGERNEDWNWATLKRDDVEMMIAGPNEHLPFDKPCFTGSFYILTNDVEKLWDDLKAKTKICYPIEDFEWGMREFAVYDNNEYILQFGQSIVADRSDCE